MKRVLLVVAYDGTAYHGFQKQDNAGSIEEELNKALFYLTGEEIEVIGASRTDSGVHALGNLAVFDTESPIPGEKFSYALNQRLPGDIRIRESKEVDADYHPRKTGLKKTYEYRIFSSEFPLPTRRLYTCFSYHTFDVPAMDEAGKCLIGEHDFTSFCTVGAQVDSKVRTITDVTVYQEGDEIVIRVTGTGFLYNMVRIIAGTLMEVGLGRMAKEDVAAALEAKERNAAGPTAPACGLTLIGYHA